MNNFIQEFVEQLLASRTEVVERMRQRREEDKADELKLKYYDKILTACDGTTKKTKSDKASCTKNDVIEHVTVILNENNTLEVKDLKDLAESRAAESGKDLKGFAMQFQKVLRSGLVHECRPGVYQLNHKNGPPAVVAGGNP